MNGDGHALVAEWLSAYHDGELDAGRRRQVEAHLAGCTECRAALADLESLSQVLSADEVPADVATDEAAFWQRLEPRLIDRPRDALRPEARPRTAWLRWLPGLGLLLTSATVQLAGAALTVAFLALAPVQPATGWAASLNHLAASAVMGWPAWIVPAEWTGWGMFALFSLVSAAIGVLYLAWLGYEWRYGLGAARRASQL